MNTLVILGASGHGKVIADIGLKNEYENILFLDDNATGKCLGFPIVGTYEDLERLNDGCWQQCNPQTNCREPRCQLGEADSSIGTDCIGSSD